MNEQVSALIKDLGNDNWEVRVGTALMLSKLCEVNDGAAVPALVRALKDAREEVRGYAAAALGAIRNTEAIPALAKTITTDNTWFVRASAARALGVIGHNAAVPALVQALKEDHVPGVRADAAWALGRIGDAARALGRIGDPAAVAVLAEALKKERYSPDVHAEVGMALFLLKGGRRPKRRRKGR